VKNTKRRLQFVGFGVLIVAGVLLTFVWGDIPECWDAGIALLTAAVTTIAYRFFLIDDTTDDFAELAAKLDIHESMRSSGLRQIVLTRQHTNDYTALFSNAKTIDLCFNSGKGTIFTYADVLKLAYKNGCKIRLLVNDAESSVFTDERLSGVVYALGAHMQTVSEIKGTVDKMREIKAVGSKKGTVEVRGAACFISGNIIIIDDKYTHYVPYLPYIPNQNTVRFDFEGGANEYTSKFRDSFREIWEHAKNINID
jgi:hypothetical protein